VLRAACAQLAAYLAANDPQHLVGLLLGAGRAIQRIRERQSVDVVWTGPDPGTGSGRLTAATVIDLIGEARHEILLVSYVTQTEPQIDTALAAAAARGVEVTILAERQADNPAYTSSGAPFPRLQALRLYWPASQRLPGAALHAKIIVVDRRIALVGSANLTGRAMEANLECGILIRDGSEPLAICRHIAELQAMGYLQIQAS
jgi:phosphatidylserine/phosphatidylglycerophosphate/cardiolipin synthase-like enzyme